MRWLKYWSFSFNIIPSKEIPGLISFRMDWLDLLAVQGTLNSSVISNFNCCRKIVNFALTYKQDTGGIMEKTRSLDIKAKSVHYFSFVFMTRVGPRKSLEK